MFTEEFLAEKSTKNKQKSVKINWMCVYKKMCRTKNLELNWFVFFKKDITSHKNCEWKLRMEIADDSRSDSLTLAFIVW